MSLLVAENVRKEFGGLLAVGGVTVTVEEASVTALIGPNGAGKTTLFDSLTGFESLDSGEIRFGGRRIDGLSPWLISQAGIARTFQTPTGFSRLSVWDNVMLGAADRRDESLFRALRGRVSWLGGERIAEQRASDALERVGVTEDIYDLKPGQLSAGDAKLVELARQLLTRPRLLLLDEPAAGLDVSQLAGLKRIISELRAEKVTVLVIDHNLSFVFGIADFIYVLSAGQIISSGDPHHVARDRVVIETYLGKA